ncbi:MAG TPA: NAD-dependent epimerase/dehydratase family protein [Gemmatirosa sp.]|nr:NAD-dependent epimerase/dehydratase family protein [Gemmatirosa sp.]
MRRALVTGAEGFVGRHLVAALARAGAAVDTFARGDADERLDQALGRADVVFHLAGVNRPEDPAEFAVVNTGLTRRLVERLAALGRAPTVVLASSTQAAADNAYGRSKRDAESALEAFGASSGAPVRIYRLTNVFGRGARPNYNSAVATFCHNAARGLPLRVDDESHVVRLVHVDDVVAAFLSHLDDRTPGVTRPAAGPVRETTVGALARTVGGFAEARRTLELPDLSDPLTFRLYATYLTYLPTDAFAYPLEQRTDERGTLAEFVKSPSSGQIFVSRTRPGITRGNHWHQLKAEKFLVLEGDAVVRFRAVDGSDVLAYPVRGTDFRVLDIPPGYTHSIENVGTGELVVLFWASEVFDPARPDTQFVPVLDA